MRPFLAMAAGATASILAIGGLAAPVASAAVTVVRCGNAAGLQSAVTRSAGRLTVDLAPSCAYRLARPLTVRGTLVIRGNGATVRPGPGVRGPLIADRGRLAVDDLNVTGGRTAIAVTGHGRLTVHGGSYSHMTGRAITVHESEPVETDFTGVTFDGSGVSYSDVDGGIIITRCRFLGGGISEFALYGEIDYTLITGSTAGEGGAIWADDDDGPGLVGDTITNNHADGDGGAIYVAGGGGDADLTRTIVSGNTAGGDGGGLYEDSDQGVGGANIDYSLITGNSAKGDGGGMWNIGATFRDSQVTGNTAGRNGGGVYVPAASDGDDDFYATAVAANRAAGDGGGMWAGGGASLNQHSMVTRNTAQAGGGVWQARDTAEPYLLLTGGSTVTLNEPDNCDLAPGTVTTCTG